MKVGLAVKINFLSDMDNERKNNFDFIRFIASSLVIFSHCYAVSISHASLEPFVLLTNGFCSGGQIAVDVFFVVSGYLILSSLLRRGDLFVFIEARILRLVPALFVSSIITAFVLGSFLTSMPLKEYLLAPGTWRYAFQNAFLVHLYGILPGVFTDNPLPIFVNASLWTLPIEAGMYGLVLVFGIAGLFICRKHVKILGFVVCAVLAVAGWFYSEPGVHKEIDGMLRLMSYFMLGGMLYLGRKAVPISFAGVVAGCLLLWWSEGSVFFKPLFSVLLAYSVMVAAYHPALRVFNNFAQFGDFSYGLYLYAFPIQQAVILLDVSMPIAQLFVLSYLGTGLCAVASWVLVEKRALSMKGVLPMNMRGRFMMRESRASGVQCG